MNHYKWTEKKANALLDENFLPAENEVPPAIFSLGLMRDRQIVSFSCVGRLGRNQAAWIFYPD